MEIIQGEFEFDGFNRIALPGAGSVANIKGNGGWAGQKNMRRIHRKNIQYEMWNMKRETWNMKLVTRNMKHEIWNMKMKHETRNMKYETWNMNWEGDTTIFQCYNFHMGQFDIYHSITRPSMC